MRAVKMNDLFEPPPEPPTALGRYRILSETAGIRVSPLQLGAGSLGDAWNGFMGFMSKEKGFELLDAFAAAGGNFIDTANMYQNEQSEEWLGEWMEKRGNRDQMIVATKFGNNYRLWKDGKGLKTVGNSRGRLGLSVNSDSSSMSWNAQVAFIEPHELRTDRLCPAC